MYFGLLCWRLVICRCVGLCLGLLFWFTGLPVCFCANTMLFFLLRLCEYSLKSVILVPPALEILLRIKTGTLIQCWWECKLAQSPWKAIWRFLKKLKIELAYYSVILLLGIYPKEHNSEYSRDTCTPMFTAALCTIAKLWKQPRCPTTDEWIKKMWYIYTMEFYSAIRNNDMCLKDKWMQLEDIMLSEVTQVQKDKDHMFSLICGR
jgi:hypothetical protein